MGENMSPRELRDYLLEFHTHPAAEAPKPGTPNRVLRSLILQVPTQWTGSSYLQVRMFLSYECMRLSSFVCSFHFILACLLGIANEISMKPMQMLNFSTCTIIPVLSWVLLAKCACLLMNFHWCKNPSCGALVRGALQCHEYSSTPICYGCES